MTEFLICFCLRHSACCQSLHGIIDYVHAMLESSTTTNSAVYVYREKKNTNHKCMIYAPKRYCCMFDNMTSEHAKQHVCFVYCG